MWFSALIKNLNDLGIPLPLLKWTHWWLQNRSLHISYGEENSRHKKMSVGAPHGSVLAATLFRLHVHFLPSFFLDIAVHMFADDLALVLVESLEKHFSKNLTTPLYIEKFSLHSHYHTYVGFSASGFTSLTIKTR